MTPLVVRIRDSPPFRHVRFFSRASQYMRGTFIERPFSFRVRIPTLRPSTSQSFSLCLFLANSLTKRNPELRVLRWLLFETRLHHVLDIGRRITLLTPLRGFSVNVNPFPQTGVRGYFLSSRSRLSRHRFRIGHPATCETTALVFFYQIRVDSPDSRFSIFGCGQQSLC